MVLGVVTLSKQWKWACELQEGVMSQGQLLFRVFKQCGFTAEYVNRQMVGACNYIETFQIELVHAELSQHCHATLFLTFLER